MWQVIDLQPKILSTKEVDGFCSPGMRWKKHPWEAASEVSFQDQFSCGCGFKNMTPGVVSLWGFGDTCFDSHGHVYIQMTRAMYVSLFFGCFGGFYGHDS